MISIDSLPAQKFIVHPGAFAARQATLLIGGAARTVVRLVLYMGWAEGLLPVEQTPVARLVVKAHCIGETLEQARYGLLGLQFAVLHHLPNGGIQLDAALHHCRDAVARVQLSLLQAAQATMRKAAGVTRLAQQLVVAIVVDIGAQLLGHALLVPSVGITVKPALLAGQAAHQTGHLLAGPARIVRQLAQITFDALRAADAFQAFVQNLRIAREIGKSLQNVGIVGFKRCGTNCCCVDAPQRTTRSISRQPDASQHSECTISTAARLQALSSCRSLSTYSSCLSGSSD